MRRPFLLSRTRWVGLLALLLLIDAALWLTAPWLMALGFALPIGVVGAVLSHWFWLGRGDYPIVFVSIFNGRSRKGREAAETHFGALATYLRQDASVGEVGPIQIRAVSIPLSPKQAERLLRISGALLVVRGEGDAIQDVSRWEWWGHFKEEQPDVMLTVHEFSIRSNESERSLFSRLRPTVTDTDSAHAVEGDLALTRFVEAELDISHFRTLSMIICVLGSRVLFRRTRTSTSGATLILPEPESAALLPASLHGQVAMLEAISEKSQGDDPRDVLDRLQAKSREGVGDSVFGVWLVAQWFVGTVEQRIEKDEALAAGVEIAERFPNDPRVLLNVAGLAVQDRDFEQGEEFINRAEALDARDPGIERLRGNIAWMTGDPRSALRRYGRASRAGSPQTWQIGDCHAALGHRRRALRCYRKTLRRDPTAGHAMRNARTVREIPRLLPVLPGGWRDRVWWNLHKHPQLVRPAMRLWRNRQPEDPWLASWLGRQYLIRGDLMTAGKWIILGTRIEHTNRLVPMCDALVVAYLRGEGDLHANARYLGDHLKWLGSVGMWEPASLAEIIMFPLSIVLPHVFDGDNGAELWAGFEAAGLPPLGSEPA